jgi:hypothetical protein
METNSADNLGSVQAKWGVHWKNPVLMLTFYAASFGIAVGHHFFYHSLDGKRANNQEASLCVRLSFMVILMYINPVDD